MSAVEVPPILQISGVSKRYGNRSVIEDANLDVPRQAFLVIYGPPASGKTVLMRMVMGLEQPTAGTLRLRGVDITGMPAAERNIGYVPQSFALYPHLSVYDNIAYPLKLAKATKSESAAIVQHSAEMLRIGDLLEKRPAQLSGGQKQRVAIARGIAKQTDMFVLDDPLAGLDFKLREQLVDDLRELQSLTNATFLYSTSDAIEALSLADTVAVLDRGCIAEIGPPDHLYEASTQAATMRWLGFPPANFLPGHISIHDGRPWCETALLGFPANVDPGWNGHVVDVAIRPEAIRFDSANGSAERTLQLPIHVILREDLGGEEIVYIDVAGTTLTMLVRHDEGLDDGTDYATITVDPKDLVIFSPGGGFIGQGVCGDG